MGSIQLIVDMVVDVRKITGGKRDVTSSTRSFVVVVVIERTRLCFLFSGLASGKWEKELGFSWVNFSIIRVEWER